METTILYPFEPQLGNAATFERMLTLAKKLKARVILFSVLPDDSSSDAADQVFLHLLALFGDYRARHQAWSQRLEVQFERIIRRGDVAESMRELVNGRKIDLVVCQPHNLRFNQRGIRKHLPPHLLPELIDPYSLPPRNDLANPRS